MPENSDTSLIVCPRCGKKNKGDRVYCEECGWILDSNQKPDC